MTEIWDMYVFVMRMALVLAMVFVSIAGPILIVVKIIDWQDEQRRKSEYES